MSRFCHLQWYLEWTETRYAVRVDDIVAKSYQNINNITLIMYTILVDFCFTWVKKIIDFFLNLRE